MSNEGAPPPLIVLSGPSGSGKTTVVSHLIARHPHRLQQSLSCTTRPPRPEEQDGREYHFLSEEQFLTKKEGGEFLESAEVFGYQYGTLHSQLEDAKEKGCQLILVIDVQGGHQIRGRVPALFIFLMPPSLEVLHRRLKGRNTEDLSALEERIRASEEEKKAATWYDHHVVNDQLEATCSAIEKLLFISHKTH
ncbi:MAG: guanylate kinase [Chlamydiota bacterium]|nr:guanylate kinase [Chlamydiota bacterium]